MKKARREAWELVKHTVRAWSSHYASSMGAALAFYSLFSIAPLLLIASDVAGYFFGAKAARIEIRTQLTALIGDTGAKAVDGLIASAQSPARHSLATGVGIVAFLIGATSVFNELQDSLNRIWGTPRSAQKSGVVALLRTRLLSFGMILATTFLVMVSLILSAVLTHVGRWWGTAFGDREVLAQLANVAATFLVITAMFAILYKVIPRKFIHWRDVWLGAATTSMLFSVGKQLIGIYLGHSTTVLAFGAVGSLAVFLLWVYYSAQIFLFGAEFTHIYASLHPTSPGQNGTSLGPPPMARPRAHHGTS
jgi:membrane protein